METRERLRDGNAFDDEVIWGEVERLSLCYEQLFLFTT